MRPASHCGIFASMAGRAGSCPPAIAAGVTDAVSGKSTRSLHRKARVDHGRHQLGLRHLGRGTHDPGVGRSRVPLVQERRRATAPR